MAMQRVAIVSDIHSNMIAFAAVLEHIGKNNVEAIWCLGDVVGYGPQPVECMIKTIEVCQKDRIIMGNHDHAVIHEPIGFNRTARQAAMWTNKVVRAGLFSFLGGKRKRWNWLRTLPTQFTIDGHMFVHASPRQHLEEYVLEEHTKGVSFTGEDPRQLLSENFALIEQSAFIGHTHRPGVITEHDGLYQWHNLEDLQYQWHMRDGQKCMINIGSVGQPRDGDNRACYVTFDGKKVEWHRVDYDIEAARRLVLENDELDNRLGDRLLSGR